MPPYHSQLDYIRKRVISEGKIQHLGDFWWHWSIILNNELEQLSGETLDYQQFWCEWALFEHYWPDEFFVGHNPYSTYVCQFRKMFDKAIAEGISKETFEGIWMILGSRPEVVAEPDNDCKQFKAEKMTWDHLWKGQEFPGIDPRGPAIVETRQPLNMSEPPISESDASLNSGSFGARMMEKMGYKEGQGLGKKGTGRIGIIEVQLRPRGVGLGAVDDNSANGTIEVSQGSITKKRKLSVPEDGEAQD